MTENESIVVDNKELADPNGETKNPAGGSDFQAFLLKPELLKAIIDCGFEHPSKVQHECIPQAIRGLEILCHAKPGMGKTTIFVLATLQQVNPVDNQVSVVVLCHTRELAFTISEEYERLSKYMPSVKVGVFVGGRPMDHDERVLQSNCPHIVVGTPGRILNLVNTKNMKLNRIKHFILDECDKLLGPQDMQNDVDEIFRNTPYMKQVMMFSAVLNKEIHPAWKKFMQHPIKIHGDDDDKSTLHVLWHFYAKFKEDHEKNKKLFELLDLLEYNKVVIYVRTVARCIALAELLAEHNLPAIAIHHAMPQDDRLTRYQRYQESHKKILVATNFFGRGLYFHRVNILFNYDTPEDSDTYLHRISRAGQFGVKRLAISFISDEGGAKVLNEVQDRFDVEIAELPEEIYELPQEIGISPCIER